MHGSAGKHSFLGAASFLIAALERYNSRSAIRLIIKASHLRMPFQNGMNQTPLHSDTPAVDDADLPISLENRLMEVFFDKTGHLARLETVKINRILDGQLHRFCHLSPL
jgi:hypothetical protein